MPLGQRVADSDPWAGTFDLDIELTAGLQGPGDAGQPDRVSDVQAVVVRRIGEGQRQHSEVDEVLPVDAREALGDHHLQTEITWGSGRVLPAGALPVIGTGDDHVSLSALPAFSRSHGVGAVDPLEGELGHLGDIGPIG